MESFSDLSIKDSAQEERGKKVERRESRNGRKSIKAGSKELRILAVCTTERVTLLHLCFLVGLLTACKAGKVDKLMKTAVNADFSGKVTQCISDNFR